MVNWKKVIGLIAVITILLMVVTIENATFDFYGFKKAQEPIKSEVEKTIREKGLNVEFISGENPQLETEETINKVIFPIYYSPDKFIDSVQSKTRIYSNLSVSGHDSIKKTYWTFIPDHAGYIVYKITYEQKQQIIVPNGYSVHYEGITFNQDIINYEYAKTTNALEFLFGLFLIFGTPIIGGCCIVVIYEKFLKS